MTTVLNIGDGSQQPGSDTVSLFVGAGQTVNVAVVGDTVNYFLSEPDISSATGTITTGNNQNFTAPAWLTSNGHSTLTITGGNY